MNIRTYSASDSDSVLALTIDTFGSFFLESFPAIVGDRVSTVEHSDWRENYRRLIPTLHNSAESRFAAVAEGAAGALLGYVAWTIGPNPLHGEIEILAVGRDHRRSGIADALCRHAFAEMRSRGVEVTQIGTGGDDFHAPARAFYESLGCTAVPTVLYYKEL